MSKILDSLCSIEGIIGSSLLAIACGMGINAFTTREEVVGRFNVGTNNIEMIRVGGALSGRLKISDGNSQTDFSQYSNNSSGEFIYNDYRVEFVSPRGPYCVTPTNAMQTVHNLVQ